MPWHDEKLALKSRYGLARCRVKRTEFSGAPLPDSFDNVHRSDRTFDGAVNALPPMPNTPIAACNYYSSAATVLVSFWCASG